MANQSASVESLGIPSLAILAQPEERPSEVVPALTSPPPLRPVLSDTANPSPIQVQDEGRPKNKGDGGTPGSGKKEYKAPRVARPPDVKAVERPPQAWRDPPTKYLPNMNPAAWPQLDPNTLGGRQLVYPVYDKYAPPSDDILTQEYMDQVMEVATQAADYTATSRTFLRMLPLKEDDIETILQHYNEWGPDRIQQLAQTVLTYLTKFKPPTEMAQGFIKAHFNDAKLAYKPVQVIFEQLYKHLNNWELKAIVNCYKADIMQLLNESKKLERKTTLEPRIELAISSGWTSSTNLFEKCVHELSVKHREHTAEERKAASQMDQTSLLLHALAKQQRYTSTGAGAGTSRAGVNDPIKVFCKKHNICLHYLKQKLGNGTGCTSAAKGLTCRFLHEIPAGVELPRDISTSKV